VADVRSHPAFAEESETLTRCLAECDGLIHRQQGRLERLEERLRKARGAGKEGGADVAVMNRHVRRLSKTIQKLKSVFADPYFGRISFKDPEGRPQTLYISNRPSTDLDHAHIVYWKTPVADVYFSRKGRYRADGRKFTVDLELVRQLEIRAEAIVKIFDHFSAGERTEEYLDPFLHEQLQRKGLDRLRNVVPTIQAEQNDIIRAPIDRHLVIQGGAGTGKTIALLHRLAYLIYSNSDWEPNDVLFVSPSSLFAGFAENLLPDIELDGIQSLPLSELEPGSLRPLYQGTTSLPAVTEIGEASRAAANNAVTFKTSPAFKSMIDGRLDQLAETVARQIQPFEYTVYGEKRTVETRQLRDWYRHGFERLPLRLRQQRIRDRLRGMLLNEAAPNPRGRGRGSTRSAFTTQQAESMLAQYFGAWPDTERLYRDEALAWYVRQLSAFETVGNAGVASDNSGTAVVGTWNTHFSKHSANDLGALFYMYQCIVGPKAQYKHIVIDEAQSLGPLWFFGLRMLLAPGGTMTISGDINQKPSFAGLSSWAQLEAPLEKLEVRHLSVSYRMTDQIAALARKLLRASGSSQSLRSAGRQGPRVRSLKGDRADRLGKLVRVTRALSKKYKTMGVICRSPDDASEVSSLLNQAEVPASLVETSDDEYDLGVTVIPLSLVGGLEFDAVIVFESGAYTTSDNHEARALYLAVTRAVHELVLA